MSAVVARRRAPRLSGRVPLPRAAAAPFVTVAVAAALAAIAFAADGGLLLGRTTKVELALLLGAGAAVAAAAVAGRRGPLHGGPALALLLALGLLTAASITWAVQPSDAWIETSRTLTYVAVFAGAIALVRLAPERWPSVLAGIGLAGVVVCGYALLTRVLPGELSPDEVYARLREPFGYWNAVGLMAALAVPPFLWLGARRDGSPVWAVLAFPAVGLLLVALMLSYSRGALLALALGCALWFAAVPLRLRAAAVLGTAATGAGLVLWWAFGQDALTEDRVPLAVRDEAGHALGLLLAAMLVVLTLAGVAVSFAAAARSRPPRTRRRAGAAVLCALALVPVAFALGMAASDRGLGGSLSDGWERLTDPNASSPANDPGRLTTVGSIRARYWSEALDMWSDHRWLGAGADGYATLRPRYRDDVLAVRHAHGYGVQTLADLGLAGLALSLLALVAWAWAAARATGLRRRDRGREWTPERIGLVTLTSVVVVFGVHSFVDWTWFVPATACVALLAAGWVAGRGPLGSAFPRAVPGLRGAAAPRVAVALAAVVLALVLAWSVWQPLRALDATNDGLAALERGDLAAAREHGATARDRNPVSLDPLVVLSIAASRSGDRARAVALLEDGVRLQPSNPEAWLRLGRFQLDRLGRPRLALRSLAAAVYLDPRDQATLASYLEARRRVTGRAGRLPEGQIPATPGQSGPAPVEPDGAS